MNNMTERVRAKAQEIVRTLEGMEKREAFGALTVATAQSLKYLCADNLEESLEWVLKNIAMIARSPDFDKNKLS